MTLKVPQLTSTLTDTFLSKLLYPSIGQCPIEYPTPLINQKTDIKFWSVLLILVEGEGCLHHPPWECYRADHPLQESGEFGFSKVEMTKDQGSISLG